MSADERSDPWLRRVHALLAKAESTEFPDEAEALVAKAQELMSRHAIDEAMLRATRSTAADEVTTRVILVEAPYAGPRADLLCAVARPNGCRVVLHGRGGNARRCTLVGYRSDLDRTAALYAALALQASRAMLRTTPEHGGLRAFRHAFLLGFAHRVGERLRRANDEAVASRRSSHGRSVGLALRDRDQEVDRVLRAEFPRLRNSSMPSITSAEGLRSGRGAAERVALGHRPLPIQGSLPRGG